MSSQNRSRGPGHRPARRARGAAQNAPRPLAATNLLSAEMNAASSAIIDLTFDLPVTVGDPAAPGATDADFTSSNGGTQRHGISTTQVRPNFVSVTCNGALSRNKSYTATLLERQGLIQPVNGKWGATSKNFNMPA